MKEYCEQLYAHKCDNLDEMDQFLERYKLSNSHGEINNIKRPISINMINSIILKLPKQKVQGPNALTGELYQIFNPF